MRKMMLMIGLLTAGCEPESATPEAAPTKTSAVAESSGPEKPRLISILELARAAGDDCRGPISSGRKDGTPEAEIYVLNCRNASLLVTISMEGKTKILDCKVSAALGTPCN